MVKMTKQVKSETTKPEARRASLTLRGYLGWHLLLPLFLLYCLLMLAVITNGLYQNLFLKQAQMQRQAKLLAHSAAYTDSSLIAKQVSDSMEQDPLIEDIRFYSFHQAIEYDESIDERWRNALFNQNLSFSEGVYLDPQSPDALATSLPVEDSSSSSVDGVLMGYMTVTLDLAELRKQWLQQNLPLLLIIFSLFALFAVLLYTQMKRPLSPFFSLSSQAYQLLNKGDDIDLTDLIYHKKEFEEAGYIRHLLANLEGRYQKVVNRLTLLEQQGASAEAQSNISLYSINYQSMLAHELKSDLAVITDGLARVESHYISDEQAEAIDVIRRGSHKLDATLRQITQLNRIEKGQVGVNMNELHPAQLINNVIQNFEQVAQRRGVQLVTQIHHVDQILAGDENKIRSILVELVSNAIKNTKNGNVTIDSRLSYLSDSIRWFVQVTDTGSGISKKYLEDIFLPFFKIDPNRAVSQKESDEDNSVSPDESERKSEGIGLGMAKKVAHLLGGELSVKSQIGRGSTFVLMIPLQDRKRNIQASLLSNIRIVALEDTNLKTHQHDSIVMALASFGADISLFFDRFMMIEHLQSKPYNVVILSDKMPLSVVEEVCDLVRQQESDYRALIVWYSVPRNEKTIASLQALGLDTVIDPSEPDEQKAQLIKNLTGQ